MPSHWGGRRRVYAEENYLLITLHSWNAITCVAVLTPSYSMGHIGNTMYGHVSQRSRNNECSKWSMQLVIESLFLF